VRIMHFISCEVQLVLNYVKRSRKILFNSTGSHRAARLGRNAKRKLALSPPLIKSENKKIELSWIVRSLRFIIRCSPNELLNALSHFPAREGDGDNLAHLPVADHFSSDVRATLSCIYFAS